MAAPRRPLRVKTNAFEITRLPVKRFYQYDVIDPDVGARRGSQIVDRLQMHVAPQVFNPPAVYDGRAIMFASHELRLSGAGSASFTVDMSDRPSRPDAKPRRTFTVRITRSAKAPVDPSDLNRLFSLRQQTPTTLDATNLLQLLIRAAPNLKYPHNARSYFTEVGKAAIGGGLELWSGFFQSVRPSLNRMLINIDISTTAMVKSGPLIDVCLDILSTRDVRALSFRDGDRAKNQLRVFLQNLIILVPGGRRRKIRAIVPQAGHFVFEKENANGTMVPTTVEQHYQQAHNKRLRYPDALGILIGQHSVLPAEMCEVAPGQFFRKKLPPNLTDKMVSFSTKRPDARLQAIQTGVYGREQLETPIMQYEQSHFMTDAGMVVSKQPIVVDGQVLIPPVINFGSGPLNPRNGSWNVANAQFGRGVSLKNWALINFAPGVQQSVAQRFAQRMVQLCNQRGMNGSEDCRIYRAGHPSSVDKLLDEIKGVQLVVVILPEAGTEVRRAVKFWGDVRVGIPTQCVKENKIKNLKDPYLNNVIIKINIRLNGENAKVMSDTFKQLENEPFMILGADVSHPGPGVQNQPSVASLVWSTDKSANIYHSLSVVQNPRQEIFENLGPNILKALLDFYNMNKGMTPRNLIVFRDGVSEGEYAAVAEYEIQQIKKAFDIMWQKRPNDKRHDTKVTFIVVGKRHHIRFFPSKQDEDRSGNCPSGFVATQGISSPIVQDFYLLSHQGLLGTSRPAHYIILLDEVYNNQAERVQELAYSLCHCFARATCAVSIPAPVYYAHLVCSRANFYFDHNMNFGDEMTVSSGERPPFNIDAWRNAYHSVHGDLKLSMYFI